ncbi:MAG: alpha/beta hydrolase [Pirellulaceae bacterium]
MKPFKKPVVYTFHRAWSKLSPFPCRPRTASFLPMQRLLATMILGGLAVVSFAQQVQPTHRDIAYDDQHASQKLDVYLTESRKPTAAIVYIHGGGWRAGSKDRVPRWLTDAVAAGWASVISVEYRFTDVATHPAQTDDCLRAIQFVRFNAAKWNIDPERIGVTGGSAGGHLSLYVALHDDAKKTDASDPVQQQSSRVACAVSFAGPTDWSLLSQIEHNHPAYRQLLGYEPGTPAEKMDANSKRDVSPINHLSPDDPAIMMVHGDADDIVPLKHSDKLNQEARKIGITSQLVIVPGANHGVAGAGAGSATDQATQFVRKWLKASP